MSNRLKKTFFKQAIFVATTKLLKDRVRTNRKYKDHCMQRRMLEHHVTLPYITDDQVIRVSIPMWAQCVLILYSILELVRTRYNSAWNSSNDLRRELLPNNLSLRNTQSNLKQNPQKHTEVRLKLHTWIGFSCLKLPASEENNSEGGEGVCLRRLA